MGNNHACKHKMGNSHACMFGIILGVLWDMLGACLRSRWESNRQWQKPAVAGSGSGRNPAVAEIRQWQKQDPAVAEIRQWQKSGSGRIRQWQKHLCMLVMFAGSGSGRNSNSNSGSGLVVNGRNSNSGSGRIRILMNCFARPPQCTECE